MAQLFHRAYLDPGRQFLQGRYIASSLRALNACRALMQRSGGQASFDSHCVEKHIYVPWWTAAQELAGTHSDERQALSRLEQIAEGVPPVIESFAQEITARCLLVAIADCVRFGVTPEALHGALQPYFADLLVVATRGAFRQTGEPVIPADLQVYDPARCCVRSERFSMNIWVATSLLTGVMTMGASRPPHVIESFQQLQDLANVIDNVDRAGERHVVATNEHYWLCRPSTRGPDYLLRWSETTLAFSATEFNNLRDLVSNLFSHPDIQVGLKRMRTLFGDA